MTLELTEDERREVRPGQPQPWPAYRPQKPRRNTCCCRPKCTSALMTLLYDDRDFDPAMGYALADEVMKEDWDDPKMAEYDRYEEHKR